MTETSRSSQPLTRRTVWAQAWPIILSQASTPLAGLVDTAVIGRTGDAVSLAAVAVGVTAMNLILWSFGFLRMGTTGITSQAEGAGNAAEVQSTALRAIGLGLGLGLVLMLLQGLLLALVMQFLSVENDLRQHALDYARARFWGAPFELAFYALNGWLLGLHKSAAALAVQIVMNAANIVFSLWFVLGQDLGAAGVGYGTAAAQATGFVFGSFICLRLIAQSGGWADKARAPAHLFEASALKRLFAVNADIMVRTFALLILMSWFTRAGARLGEEQLAANHVLMQIILVVAWVLDAFAYTAEARVGSAIGSGSREKFWRAVRLTGEFCLISGLALGLTVLTFGGAFIDSLTQDATVQELARNHLVYCAAICVLGVAPWMLDGIFIGATRTADMRNAAIIVTCCYIALDIYLRRFGADGPWIALTTSYAMRAIALGARMPALMRAI